MMSPATVERRASIVGWCTAELVLRNSSKPWSHCFCPRQPFPIASPWFRPTPDQLWISRLRTLHKKTAPRYCGQSTNTPRDQNCRGCEDPNNLYQKWQCRDTAPTNTPTQTETLPRRHMIQRCTMMTKVFYVPTRMPVPKQAVRTMTLVR